VPERSLKEGSEENSKKKGPRETGGPKERQGFIWGGKETQGVRVEFAGLIQIFGKKRNTGGHRKGLLDPRGVMESKKKGEKNFKKCAFGERRILEEKKKYTGLTNVH